MLHYLKNLDWRDLAASAFVLLCLFAIASPRSSQNPIAAESERGQAADSQTKSGNEISPIDRGITDAITAGSTAMIALFTIILVVVTNRQAKLTRESLRLANREYASSHRPKIHIQRIAPVPLVSGDRAAAVIEAINSGDTDATIIAIGIDIFHRRPILIGSGAFIAVPQPRAVQLAPGQQANLEVHGGAALPQPAINEILAGTLELCMLGIIHYWDGNQTLRLTSFFRIFDPARNRYRHAPKDDEHADREYES